MFVASKCISKGEWSEWSSQVNIPPFSAGIQFGISVFEGMYAHFLNASKQAEVMFLENHYARLEKSSALLGIKIPDLNTFEKGLIKAIEKITQSQRGVLKDERLYLRSVHFSGCEDIFPASAYPFFTTIFARPVPSIKEATSIRILADQPYIRSTLGSELGSTKSAINYTQLIERDLVMPKGEDTQRLWISPEFEHHIQELDTMAIGFILPGGHICIPPSSPYKLQSITMQHLTTSLVANGYKVSELKINLTELEERLKNNTILGLFAVSTGKGLAMVKQIQVDDKKINLSTDEEISKELWACYMDITQ